MKEKINQKKIKKYDKKKYAKLRKKFNIVLLKKMLLS